MDGEILKSGRDMLLFGIPLILLLAAGMFRLDELVMRKRKKPAPPSPGPAKKTSRHFFFADPDGKPLRRDRHEE